MKYEIGARLKYYREKKHLQQKEVAAALKISVQKLSNWENGANRPNVEMIPLICSVLDVSPNELLQTPSTSSILSPTALHIAQVYDTLPPLGRAVMDAFVTYAKTLTISKEM